MNTMEYVVHINCLEITKKEISKIPRTTGNAEQRMGVLKNIQLGGVFQKSP